MYNVISGRRNAPLPSVSVTTHKTTFFAVRPHWLRRGAVATAFAAVAIATAPFVLKSSADKKIISLTGAVMLAAYARKFQSAATDYDQANNPTGPRI